MKCSRAAARVAAVCVVAVSVVSSGAGPAFAGGVVAAPASLGDVVENLRNWLVGLLVGLATLYLTVGGVRYLAANGDPSQVERAKTALRSAAIGYTVAALAPLLVSTLKSVIGA